MKLLIRILIILFVNKLSVKGEAREVLLSNTSSTAVYEAPARTPGKPNNFDAETLVKEILSEFNLEKDGIENGTLEIEHDSTVQILTSLDMSRQTTTERELADSVTVYQVHNMVSKEILDIPKKQEGWEEEDNHGNTVSNSNPVQLDKLDKYQISKGLEDNRTNFNQSWSDNRAKAINEYNTIQATKFLHSNDPNQSSNLLENELIEIVLKEATNLNETPANNQSFAINMTQGVIKVIKEEADETAVNSSELLSILNFEKAHNYADGDSDVITNLNESRAEEEAVTNVEEALAEKIATPSEGTDPLNSAAENQLNTDVLKGITTNVNLLQEETAVVSTDTTPLNVDELTSGPANSWNILETSNRPALNQIQENYLIAAKLLQKVNASIDAITELNQNSNGVEENNNLTRLQDSTGTKVWNESVLWNNISNESDFSITKALSTIETTTWATKFHGYNERNDDSKKEVTEPTSTLATKHIFGNDDPQAINILDKELWQVTSASGKVADLSSIERPVHPANSTTSNTELLPEQANHTQIDENQKQYTEYSLASSEEEVEEDKSSSIPKITLEEYAVKQMDFILDHLLLETQKFVAKVLQATINSVFPRDRLKHYAEGVNQVLNPATESLYSAETDDQDEIYEQLVEKLDFLKSKPSKYLQKQIPPEWLNEFLEKRTELAIWLDKAAEQMHKEFTIYITEDEDPIKYQYFGETFDDISRATEIHHKLALLADLVKIIKNKKQITFMDLYMQT